MSTKKKELSSAKLFENNAELYRMVLDPITDGWWDVNLETGEDYMSPSMKALLGYEDHEIPNGVNAWQDLLFPEDLAISKRNLELHMETKGEHPYFQEVRYKHKDGSTVWVICRGQAVIDQDGVIRRIVGTHTDITSLKLTQQKLSDLVYLDALTQLPNRSSFIAELSKELTETENNHAKILAVLFIDVDNFKTINDTLGHEFGDNLLISVAKRLNNEKKETDFLARLSGDEFGVILRGLNNQKDLDNILKRFISIFRQYFDLSGTKVKTSISIGAAIYPKDGNSPSELIKHADIAMYSAKRAGKNRFAYYTESLVEDKMKAHA